VSARSNWSLLERPAEVTILLVIKHLQLEFAFPFCSFVQSKRRGKSALGELLAISREHPGTVHRPVPRLHVWISGDNVSKKSKKMIIVAQFVY